jgi:hypothetical protein
MMTTTQRTIETGPIYFVIEKHTPSVKPYPEGHHLEDDNKKPVWHGYLPEEIGHKYQELCDYATRNSNTCNGGIRIGDDGIVTVYSQKKLETDYDPTEV